MRGPFVGAVGKANHRWAGAREYEDEARTRRENGCVSQQWSKFMHTAAVQQSSGFLLFFLKQPGQFKLP